MGTASLPGADIPVEGKRNSSTLCDAKKNQGRPTRTLNRRPGLRTGLWPNEHNRSQSKKNEAGQISCAESNAGRGTIEHDRLEAQRIQGGAQGSIRRKALERHEVAR